MKYTNEITIDLPRPEFIKKLDNPENMKHWQRELVSYKVLSGTPGKEGAQMELRYITGNRKIVMIETIMKRNLPYEFHATYDAKSIHNIQKKYFRDVDDHTTKWISEAEFQLNGVMLKLMGFLMPGIFRKQSVKYLKDFKAFAEIGTSVAQG